MSHSTRANHWMRYLRLYLQHEEDLIGIDSGIKAKLLKFDKGKNKTHLSSDEKLQLLQSFVFRLYDCPQFERSMSEDIEEDSKKETFIYASIFEANRYINSLEPISDIKYLCKKRIKEGSSAWVLSTMTYCKYANNIHI